MQPHKPHPGDAVWVEGREPQPNGRIERIAYDDEEAVVVFHDGGGIEYIAIEDMLGNKEGQVWMIYQPKHLKVEDRMDVMIFFDLEVADQCRIPRLMFLSWYFLYKHPAYGPGCKRRLELLARLIGKAEHVDWLEVHRLRGVFDNGARISASLRAGRA